MNSLPIEVEQLTTSSSGMQIVTTNSGKDEIKNEIEQKQNLNESESNVVMGKKQQIINRYESGTRKTPGEEIKDKRLRTKNVYNHRVNFM